jgi:hypothetical protein
MFRGSPPQWRFERHFISMAQWFLANSLRRRGREFWRRRWQFFCDDREAFHITGNHFNLE